MSEAEKKYMSGAEKFAEILHADMRNERRIFHGEIALLAIMAALFLLFLWIYF